MPVHLGRSRYDPDLQMFTDEPGVPDPARLGFLRWLAERGRLEHATAGDPAGEHANLEPTDPPPAEGDWPSGCRAAGGSQVG